MSLPASMLPGVTTLAGPLNRALGPKTAKALEAALGLRTVGDLLRHYPRRYYTRGELTDLSSLREGDHVTVLARVDHVSLHTMKNRNFRARGEVIITDDRAKLVLTFFFRTTWAEQNFRQQLVPGVVGMFAGTVSDYRGRLQLVHPEYELLPGAPPNADLTPELAAEFATELIPVYPATAKVSSWGIGKSIQTILATLDAGPDPLPAELVERYGLYGRAEAIRAIHRPLDWADRTRAIERLKWDEAFMLQAALAGRHRRRVRRPPAVHPHRGPGGGGGDHRARSGLRLPDAPAAAGRGRLGQDGNRDPGHAPGGRRGRSGRTAGPDRSPRPAALPVGHRHARPAGPARPAGRRGPRHRGGPAHRVGGRGRAALGPVRRVHRRCRDRDRHARAAGGAGPVRRPGPGGHRRAAPVRRRAARRAAGQGGRQPAARAGHDGHAHPQDGRHDRLRGPGDLHADRAARRAVRDRDARGARGRQAALPRAGLGARQGGSRPGPAGLRGLPAHRRRPGDRRARRGRLPRRGRLRPGGPQRRRSARHRQGRPAAAAVSARRGRDAGRGPAGRAAPGHPAR